MADMRQAALTYIQESGLRKPWAVFPLANFGNVPAKGGHGFKDATTDAAQVEAWWTERPKANIGVQTGEKNNLLCIDVDLNHSSDGDGEATLRALVERLGELPETVESRTPNGGRHLWFQYPGHGIGIYTGNADDGTKAVDIRGQGGYITAPPSRRKANDGEWRDYTWTHSPKDTQLAELPETWVEWASELCGEKKRPGESRAGRLPRPENVGRGGRNDYLIRVGGAERRKGAGYDEIRATLLERNSRMPEPLDVAEVDAVARSAASYPAGKKQPVTLGVVEEALKALNVSIRFNVITNSFEYQGKTPDGRTINDKNLWVQLRELLVNDFKGVMETTVMQLVHDIGYRDEYNPVLELLERTPWDGVDRLPQVFDVLGIPADDTLSPVLVTKWLYQAVALLMSTDAAPIGAEGVLSLVGEQRTGKTSFFRWLAMADDESTPCHPEWFGGGLCINDKDKDTLKRVVTCWIAELGEADATMKSDVSKLKAFITSERDMYRLPYERADENRPRRTSICSTCNPRQFLVDSTGNARWWTIPFRPHSDQRAVLLKLDALQLWAQVYEFMKELTPVQRRHSYNLSAAELEQLAVRNSEHEKPLKAQDEVADILAAGTNWQLVTVTQFKQAWPALRGYTANQLGAALEKLGISANRTGAAGTRKRNLPMPTQYP